jgi:hypothetical protein
MNVLPVTTVFFPEDGTCCYFISGRFSNELPKFNKNYYLFSKKLAILFLF